MAETQTVALSFGEVPFLDVAAEFGDLKLIALPAGEEARVEVSSMRKDARVDVTRDGEVVRVRTVPVDRMPFLLIAPEVKLTLYVPAHVRARVRTEFGRIKISGLDGGCDLDLGTSAGAITLEQVYGRLFLRTGAGTITGDRLAGSFDVESAAGAVRLGVLGLEPGRHTVRTQLGAVRLALSPTIQTQLRVGATMGSARADFPNTPGAACSLDVTTELGSVRVGQGDSRDDRHGDFPRWDAFPAAPWAGKRAASEPVARPSTPAAATPTAPPPPAASASAPGVGEEELRRILAMVEQGKITAAEAERLIRAIERR